MLNHCDSFSGKHGSKYTFERLKPLRLGKEPETQKTQEPFKNRWQPCCTRRSETNKLFRSIEIITHQLHQQQQRQHIHHNARLTALMKGKGNMTPKKQKMGS